MASPPTRTLGEGDPYLIFYIDRDDHVDVWRVLHAQRDIPARLRERHS
jgi:toxin ParE1/3/4